MPRLTQKQERFAVEYVRTGSGAEAYRRAYAAERMSHKTVHEAASRLLKNSKVVARVDELREAIAEEAVITEARTLGVLADLAYFDPAELYDENGDLLPVREMPKDARMAIASVKTKRVPGSPAVTEEVKLWSRGTAVDALVKLQNLAGRVQIPGLAEAETLAEQGKAVIAALATGNIPATTVASVLQALSAHAKIIEVDELVRRIEALEAGR